MELAYPLALLLLSPVFLAGWYAIRKGIPKPLIISRMIIVGLLIVALTSPFELETTTIKEDAPRITIISDQTMSMDLFDKENGQNIFESIKSKTPTTFRQFSGISSPIGDEVIAESSGYNNIVLVSDGNNNLGKDLFDSIAFVSKTGTKVFAVRQDNIHNDASVEIVSPKNLIVGNMNTFNVVVRQAGESTRYRLNVKIDGASVMSEDFTQSERTEIHSVSHTFNTLGTHTVIATITPTGEDRFNLNNVFYKSVFVVPKPKILVLASDTGSPLYEISTGLYDVKLSTSMPDDMGVYKAVIADNRFVGQLNADALRTYVSDGGGFVAVGGDSAYDKGEYNNSPVEAILPIISKASEYKGGKNVVIIVDASDSAVALIAYITEIAGKLIKNIEIDSNVAVVVVGMDSDSTDLLPMSVKANRDFLINYTDMIEVKIRDPTNLYRGFQDAEKLLSSTSGTKEIIVLSDGQKPMMRGEIDTEAIEANKEATIYMTNQGFNIHFVQMADYCEINPTAYFDYNELGLLSSDGLVTIACPGDSLRPLFEAEPDAAPTPTPTPEITQEFALVAVDSEHFITKYTNLTASITGYNDITPKLGSDRLIATTGGKPIITTWGFGLGRVASFTSDNGAGSTRWASAMYSGENARIISSMVNWAIGDPRPTEGVVIQAEDIWAGTGGKVVITSDTLPKVKLDGSAIDVSRTGPDTYETTLSLEKEGFHDLSGYGIAVNYPLEYREVGFNEKLETVIASNGGRVYDQNEVESLLLLDIKEKAVRTVQEPKSKKELFLLAALLLFLSEVIFRRLKDRGKERPNIQDNTHVKDEKEETTESMEE